MDERGKSGAFVDVKDSSEHGENIFEERVDILFRKPTFVIMSLPFHFREAGSTRLLLLTFLFQSSSVLPVLLFVVLLSFRFATCLRWRLDDATLIVVSTAFIIRNDGWVLRRVASIINHHVNQGEQGGHGEGGEAGEVGGVQGESLAHQVAGLCSQVSAL